MKWNLRLHKGIEVTEQQAGEIQVTETATDEWKAKKDNDSNYRRQKCGTCSMLGHIACMCKSKTSAKVRHCGTR